MVKMDKKEWPMIKLLTLCEKFGWTESVNKIMIQGHRGIMFNEVLTRSEAEKEAKILRELGCLAKIVAQKPEEVCGEKNKYAVYYWHAYHY